MHKWEYCTVGPLHGGLNPIFHEQKKVTILYMNTEGIRELTLEPKVKRLSNLVAIMVAQLGLKGWEMVGCGTVDAVTSAVTAIMHGVPRPSHMLYFKRPVAG